MGDGCACRITLRLRTSAGIGLAVIGSVTWSRQQPLRFGSPPAQGPSPSAEAVVRERFELKRVCSELGERRFREAMRDQVPGSTPINPKYGYSKPLNTCVYSGGFIGKGTISFSVVNLLTNEEPLMSAMVNGTALGISRQEYEAREKQLFAGCIQ